jgi:hypothetical protein
MVGAGEGGELSIPEFQVPTSIPQLFTGDNSDRNGVTCPEIHNCLLGQSVNHMFS